LTHYRSALNYAAYLLISVISVHRFFPRVATFAFPSIFSLNSLPPFRSALLTFLPVRSAPLACSADYNLSRIARSSKHHKGSWRRGKLNIRGVLNQ